ncbi:MAG: Flp pilus assembly complex ATPase component TadA [Planctomycetes bacterium]|nr:Flp pilus assembly complex ATPase component TadA [Planctomycetota bacterium]
MDRVQLEDLLASVVRSGGTSLHIQPYGVPFVRVGDSIIECEVEAVTAQVIADLMRDFLFEDHRNALQAGEDVEILYTTAAGERFRATVMRQCRGLGAVFRRLPTQVPSFEELGLPPGLSSLTGFQRGLVVLTGFVGSGKSTTLAALVQRMNEEGAFHIATIEQPIEFVHRSEKCLIHQREVGMHVQSIARGVRDAYRQGAEVIVVDGLEDYDALQEAFRAVERGCFVFATMSSSNVVGAITDLARIAPADDRKAVLARLACLLRGVAAQSLINRLHGHTRIPVFEIMIRTEAIANAIRTGDFGVIPELIARGRGLGMQTNDQALRALLSHNVIAPEVAAYHAVDRDAVVPCHH